MINETHVATALSLLYVPALAGVLTSVVNRHVPLPASYRMTFNLTVMFSLFLWLRLFLNITG